MKVRLCYIGMHQPKEIVEVEESLAKSLVRHNDYAYVDEDEKPMVKPSLSDLSDEQKDRVEDLVEDLADDGKRNFSNDDSKKSPGRKKK